MTASEMTPADFAAISGNNNDNGFGGGNGAWWLIVLFIFALCGYGGFGGFGGGGSQGAADNYILASDFSQIERKLDGVYSGICDATFSLNNSITNGFAAAQNTMTQGFAGLNMAMVQQGYENRMATQGVQNTLQNCCCDLRQQISDVNYNIATQANGIGRQIENGFAQTNYNMASQNCQTMQAIEKVGDRVIDYLSQQENQRLRDEVAQYRAHANSQYVINELTPKCPVPAYLTCNPNAPLNYSINYGGCGCNC